MRKIRNCSFVLLALLWLAVGADRSTYAFSCDWYGPNPAAYADSYMCDCDLVQPHCESEQEYCSNLCLGVCGFANNVSFIYCQTPPAQNPTLCDFFTGCICDTDAGLK